MTPAGGDSRASEPPARLPYGTDGLDLPSAPFRLEPVAPPRSSSTPAGEEGIRAALARPLASPPLAETFRGARRVLVVVSDATRSTGARDFLPPLLEEIEAVSRAEVRFAVASGIHRRPTPEDVEALLGPRLAARHEVLLHDPDDRDRLLEIGRTRAGTPVEVLGALRDHDRVVLTGAVGFHYYAGFSGGRKAVVPGLASRATVTANHLRALRPTARATRWRARGGWRAIRCTGTWSRGRRSSRLTSWSTR